MKTLFDEFTLSHGEEIQALLGKGHMIGVFFVALALYLFKRYRLFEIAFVGKRLCVNERHFPRTEIQHFIQTIYLTKRKQNDGR
jgi:hypothetical protein